MFEISAKVFCEIYFTLAVFSALFTRKFSASRREVLTSKVTVASSKVTVASSDHL